VIELTTALAPTEDLRAEIDQPGTVLRESIDESGLHAVTQTPLCSLEDALIGRFGTQNGLYQPPTVHRQGCEYNTIVAFAESLLDVDRRWILLGAIELGVLGGGHWPTTNPVRCR